jgi:hypothetical protein
VGKERRLVDIRKWVKPWYHTAPGKLKLAWDYTQDQCDHCGLWYVNFTLLSQQTGFEVTKDEFVAQFGERLVELKSPDNEEVFFFPCYLQEQYPKGLSLASNVHKAVLETIQRYRLEKTVIGMLPPAMGFEGDEEANGNPTGTLPEGSGEDTGRNKNKTKNKIKKGNKKEGSVRGETENAPSEPDRTTPPQDAVWIRTEDKLGYEVPHEPFTWLSQAEYAAWQNEFRDGHRGAPPPVISIGPAPPKEPPPEESQALKVVRS